MMNNFETLGETRPSMTLAGQSLRAVSRNMINAFILNDQQTSKAVASEMLHTLPSVLSEKVRRYCVKDAQFLMQQSKQFNEFLALFFEGSGADERVPIRNIHLRNAIHLKDKTLGKILKANPSVESLDVRGCSTLTMESISAINKAKTLRSLQMSHLKPGKISLGSLQLKCPNLENLVISSDLKPRKMMKNLFRWKGFMDYFLDYVIPQVKYLDMSNFFVQPLSLAVLEKAKCLETLIFCYPGIHTIWGEIIDKLDSLKVLDLRIIIHPNSHPNEFKALLTNISTTFENHPSLRIVHLSGINVDGQSVSYTVERRTNPAVMEVTENLDFHQLISAFKTQLDISPQILSDIVKAGLDSTSDPIEMKLRLIIRWLKDPNVSPRIQSLNLEMLFPLFSKDDTRFSGPLQEDLLKAVFQAIRNYYFDFRVIKAAYLVLKEIKFPTAFAFNFKDISQMVLDIDEVKPMGLQTCAIHCRIREMLTRRINVNHAEHLCQLNIIQKSIKFFEMLHFAFFQHSLHGIRDIVGILWTTMSNVMKLSMTATEIFIKFKGLNWLISHLYRIPELKSASSITEIIRTVENVLENTVANNRQSSHRMFKNKRCLQSIKDLLNPPSNITIKKKCKKKWHVSKYFRDGQSKKTPHEI